MDKQKYSNTFYIVRALAIICVVAAHCDSSHYALAESIRRLLGTVGVPCFLVCSGLFFQEYNSSKVFWLRKLKHIIIPWIVWGVITYTINIVFTNKAISICDGIRWLLGYKTWLYYVPVLLCCYLLIRISRNKKWIILLAALSVTSWMLAYFGIIQTNDYITLYQNPFIFLVFFLLGYKLQKYDIEKIIRSKLSIKLIFTFMFLVFGILYIAYGKKIGYWNSIFSIPFEIMACIIILWIAQAFERLHLLISIGKRSYFIYFIHMQIGIQIMNKLVFYRILKMSNSIWDIFLVIGNPMLVVLFSYLISFGVRQIIKCIHLEKYAWIISV